MEISSLLTRFLDQTPLTKRSSSAEATDNSSGNKSSSPTSNDAAQALRDILAKYDVTSISPRQFSEMLQALRQAGAITDGQFQELSTMLTDLNSEGIDPDEEVNLVELTEKQLKESHDEAGPVTTAALERRLEWLQKSALIQSGPGAASLDSLA